MEQITKLPVDTGKVVLSEDYKSILRNLFSGCRVNFLLGAGFSAVPSRFGPVDKSKNSAESHSGSSRTVNLEIAKDGIYHSLEV